MLLFARGKAPGSIYVSREEDSALLLAVADLASDVEKVCGVRPPVVHTMGEDTAVVVATAPLCPPEEALAWDLLREETGALRWEGCLRQELGGRLYLLGSDRRGAIYAVYQFCREIGVSPWYWMADVPVKRREELRVPRGVQQADWPWVQYRGIFLNDEEELEAWAKAHTADDTIGPETYRRIFELLLRLGGNMIWPAMHVNAFNLDPENVALAQRMGIVTGTSHCDMLHRSNQNEWGPWRESHGCPQARYDYTIPGENRERLLEYWRGSLQLNRESEAVYTIGMRGIHDGGGIKLSGLDTEKDSPGELLARKRQLMEEIMDVQRRLLREELHREDVPQSFIPYKEVLPIYDSGLRVPEDVMLVWVDDNHGHLRRYPSPRERKRAGGHGLYYHSSYWAPPGMSWLFLCSTPLSRMGDELKKCWEQGIRRMWIDNVGALKPIEQDMEYFLRYGWDAGRPESPVHRPEEWTARWLDENFSGGIGKETAALYSQFAQLNNLTKPEHMRSRTFSQTAWGDEAGARVWRLFRLSRRCREIGEGLPAEEQSAFFQLMLMKMEAAFFVAASYYYADRSRDLYDLGAMAGAEGSLKRSRQMDDLKRLLIYYYNNVMSGGKWSGILTPEEFPPPTLELCPPCAPALRLERGRALLRLPRWGAEEGLPFPEEGITRWLELFNSGAGTIPFRIQAPPGVKVFPAEGRLEEEVRILVRLEEGEGGRLTVTAGEDVFSVPVFRTAQEAFLRLEVEQAAESRGFVTIPHMGRGRGWAAEAVGETSPARPAELVFRFALAAPCAPELEVTRCLTLNSVGEIGMEIGVDGLPPVTMESPTTDEWRGSWRQAVLHDGERLLLPLPGLEAGEHTLTLTTATPYLTLSALTLYLGRREESQGGAGLFPEVEGLPRFNWEELAKGYGMAPEEVPPPGIPVVAESFWSQDLCYARNEVYHPKSWGSPKRYETPQGGKDVFSARSKDAPCEREGRILLSCADALAEDRWAWMTEGTFPRRWSHRQGESDGRSAIALWLPTDLPAPVENGPRLHYRFRAEGGRYGLWLLAKYDDGYGFHLGVTVDGRPLPREAHTDFHTYRIAFQWCWLRVGGLTLDGGEHTLCLEGKERGLSLDKICLRREDRPPGPLASDLQLEAP